MQIIHYKITNLTRNTLLAQNAELADTPFKRMKGLLGRLTLGPESGLIIQPCSSIHTFFMRFPIDVLFLDLQNRVLGIYKGIPPFRLSKIHLLAVRAVELPVGILDKTGTQKGDLIEIKPSHS